MFLDHSRHLLRVESLASPVNAYNAEVVRVGYHIAIKQAPEPMLYSSGISSHDFHYPPNPTELASFVFGLLNTLFLSASSTLFLLSFISSFRTSTWCFIAPQTGFFFKSSISASAELEPSEESEPIPADFHFSTAGRRDRTMDKSAVTKPSCR